MPGDLLTTGEAAAIIGVSYCQVGVYIRQGQIPAQRFNRFWLIKRSDVEAFRRHKPGPKKARPVTA